MGITREMAIRIARRYLQGEEIAHGKLTGAYFTSADEIATWPSSSGTPATELRDKWSVFFEEPQEQAPEGELIVKSGDIIIVEIDDETEQARLFPTL